MISWQYLYQHFNVASVLAGMCTGIVQYKYQTRGTAYTAVFCKTSVVSPPLTVQDLDITCRARGDADRETSHIYFGCVPSRSENCEWRVSKRWIRCSEGWNISFLPKSEWMLGNKVVRALCYLLSIEISVAFNRKHKCYGHCVRHSTV